MSNRYISLLDEQIIVNGGGNITTKIISIDTTKIETRKDYFLLLLL